MINAYPTNTTKKTTQFQLSLLNVNVVSFALIFGRIRSPIRLLFIRYTQMSDLTIAKYLHHIHQLIDVYVASTKTNLPFKLRICQTV